MKRVMQRITPGVYGLDSTISTVKAGTEYSQRCLCYIKIVVEGTNMYRMDIRDILYLNDGILEKNEDLMRRLAWRFDGVQFTLDEEGKIDSITNMEELYAQWKKLLSYLEADYVGVEAEWYWDQLSVHIQDMESVINELERFSWLGMILPAPPRIYQIRTNKEWIELETKAEYKVENQMVMKEIKAHLSEKFQDKYILDECYCETDANFTDGTYDTFLEIILHDQQLVRNETYHIYKLDDTKIPT